MEQRRKLRGTTAQLDTQTGGPGVMMVDTILAEIRLFDGATIGGHRFVSAERLSLASSVNPSGGINVSMETVTLPPIGPSPSFDQTMPVFRLRTPQTLSPTSNNSAGTDSLGHTHAITGFVPALQEMQARGIHFISADGINTFGDGVLGDIGGVRLQTPVTLSATSINWHTSGPNLADGHTHKIDATIARSAITISAGNGLTGGGSLAENRTISLGTPSTLNGSTTNATTALSHTHAITGFVKSDQVLKTSGLIIIEPDFDTVWSSPLSSVATLQLQMPRALSSTSVNEVGDQVNKNNGHTHEIDSTIARSAINIVAGNGLTGGGTLAANRTLAIGTPGSVSATSTNSVTSTSHTHALASGTIAATVSDSAFPVDTIVFAKPETSTSTRNFGQTLAGTNALRCTDGDGTSGTLIAVDGTWKCLGRSVAGSATMWIRTA